MSGRRSGARSSTGNETGHGRPKRASAISYVEPSDEEDEGDDLNVDELDQEPEGEDEDAEGDDDDEAEGEEEDVEVEGVDEDGEGEDEDAGDGEGEDDEDEIDDQMEVDGDGNGEVDDDGEGEEEEDQEQVKPVPSVKLRFKLAPTLPAAASSSSNPKRAYKKAKRTHDTGSGSDDGDELGYSEDDSRRSISPSKLTARQRAKYDKDLQDTLLSLPAEGGNKKAVILTEAERIQRREENARRRKRQTEQRQQDEQDQTINRLLRAQTAKSRSKLDAPADSGGTSGPGAGSTSNSNGQEEGEEEDESRNRRSKPLSRHMAPKGDMIRFVSRLNDGCLVNVVGVPSGKEDWLGMGLGKGKEVVAEDQMVKSEMNDQGGLDNDLILVSSG